MVARLEQLARAWGIAVSETRDAGTSLIGYGFRFGIPVVLKISKAEDDEWRSGEILAAFGGAGVARAYEHAPGAVVLERIRPGADLTTISDEEATAVLADVMRRMSPSPPPPGVPTVRDWGMGFDRYLASSDDRIDRSLVSTARDVYNELCASQSATRLLHGDLHHYNILHDRQRGWLAIDPKGVIGEPEYELGAFLRNPHARPDLVGDPAAVARRVRQLSSALGFDERRVLRWAFSQAVLSAIWTLEDGEPLEPDNPALLLAHAAGSLIGGDGTIFPNTMHSPPR